MPKVMCDCINADNPENDNTNTPPATTLPAKIENDRMPHLKRKQSKQDFLSFRSDQALFAGGAPALPIQAISREQLRKMHRTRAADSGPTGITTTSFIASTSLVEFMKSLHWERGRPARKQDSMFHGQPRLGYSPKLAFKSVNASPEFQE
jgi:hypothetical protein